MKTECVICKDLKGETKYYTPTPQERRDYFFKDKGKLSHTYCPTCYVLNLKSEGFDLGELEVLVKELEKEE